jgi:nucleolar GTP-binding protein
MKMKGNKINDVINKIHLAQPQKRDNIARLPNIPAETKTRVQYDKNDPNRRKLERDIEAENGGAGVFNVDVKKKYLLEDDEWKYDKIPEFLDGHNVADFIDPEIEEKLEALEREEERLEAEGFYQSDEEILDDEEEVLRTAADAIRDRKKLIVQAHRAARGRTRPVLPKTTAAKFTTVGEMGEHLESMGIDATDASERTRSAAANRKRTRSDAIPDEAVRDADAHDRGDAEAEEISNQGFRNVKQKLESEKQHKKVQQQASKMGKRGESDRQIQTKMPRHLFSGKRGMGSTDRR